MEALREAFAATRNRWLSAVAPGDLVKVETDLRSLLRALSGRRKARDETKIKKRPRNEVEILEEDVLVEEIRSKLLLLLCQFGDREVDVFERLSLWGKSARLSPDVLAYANPPPVSPITDLRLQLQLPLRIEDSVLSDTIFNALCNCFKPMRSDYWLRHNYTVEPPSPFFSYVLPLEDLARKNASPNALYSLVDAVNAASKGQFPGRPEPRFAEVWAHCRPHATGHQMHFDSDDEGRNGIRNPTIGSVFFLTGDVGGPTLVTDQRHGATKLASKGYFVYPVANRLVVFDGTMLHGVVPGRGVPPMPTNANGDPLRRVTIMVALWTSIKVRNELTPGSARPIPTSEKEPEWLRTLRVDGDELASKPPIVVQPVPVSPVWVTPEGRPWPAKAAMPPYDKVFQGF